MNLEELLTVIQILQKQVDDTKGEFNKKFKGCKFEFDEIWLKHNHREGDCNFTIERIIFTIERITLDRYCEIEYSFTNGDDSYGNMIHIKNFMKYAKLIKG